MTLAMSGGPAADHLIRMARVLEEAQERGILGPGPVEAHLEHAQRFVAAIEPDLPRRALDLGSGAGVPGLVLASHWNRSRWVLLDAAERRTVFLAEAVKTLGLGDRVEVWRGRAELLAHEPERRASFDLVVARSFGSPAVVAECAAGFLSMGGRLVVSEPPNVVGTRWPDEGLARLGMELVSVGEGVAVVARVRPCPAVFPRRVGVPAKRPLF